MPSLFVFRGNDEGVRFELAGQEVALGRDASNAVQLHDSEVSRRHAIIRLIDGRYTLSDASSANGTFVNGQRVTSHVLASGDELQLGGTLLLFTGASGDSNADLAEKIDIIARQQADDRARIVSSISHEEGSRLFSASSAAAEEPWVARARSHLQVVYRTALAVSHTLDIDDLLHRIMQLIFEWVEADRGCIMLVDPETRRLEPRVRRNRRAVRSDDRIAISKTILDYVMDRNEGVLTSDARADQRWDAAASILQMGIREAICVPMQGRYAVVGVIYIDTARSAQQAVEQRATAKFTDEHLKLMIAIAHQAALAVEDTRYYSAMLQAERLAAVGQTIATLSHHIKNILQGIRASSFLIKDGLHRHDEAMIAKGWEFVERNQERISNLVMDMLAFSKEREPEMAPGDVNQVVADVVELMEARARERGIELRWKPCAQVPRISFDHEGIHRAVLNVVTNAIDACEKAAQDQPEPDAPRNWVEIGVAYDPVDTLVQITIEDTGPGIPPEEIDQVFALFVSHKGCRGTGLGLPVSQKILKEHGGRIEVASEPGRGARFTLELPAILADATEPLDSSAPRENMQTAHEWPTSTG